MKGLSGLMECMSFLVRLGFERFGILVIRLSMSLPTLMKKSQNFRNAS